MLLSFMGLMGGLAFFLYGMEKMSKGLNKTAGDNMRTILSALTNNRVVALFVGAFVTMVIQSSSATTVMLVSFVQAGLMSFTSSMGIILGADIGTTVTTQLIAFKISDYSLLMIAFGFGLRMFGKTERIKSIGDILLGFGILFYGMKVMSDAMKPLRTHQTVINFMKELENPLIGILTAAVLTALIQSSSAFTGIIIVLANQGIISLEAGIPMIFGANIGTCVTAAFACIGMSREAKRVALAHVLIKVAGVMLFLFWIPDFANMIRAIASKYGSDTARQIANAHTFFNVSIGLLFLPFISFFVKISNKILPDKKEEQDYMLSVRYLDENFISSPAIAIDLARIEISRMAKLLERMLRAIIIPFMSCEKSINFSNLSKEEVKLLINEIPKHDEIFPDLSLIEGVDLREKKIDYLEEKIVDYLLKIAQHDVSESQANEVYSMMSIASDMESIGDIIHRNMLPLIKKKQQLEMDFHEEGKEELLIYHGKMFKQIRLLKEAFTEANHEKAKNIIKKEEKYFSLEQQYRLKHLERLVHEKQGSIETHEVHMELMDLMKQIIVYSSNIAKAFVNIDKKRFVKKI